jgi:putative ABC transport system substrate-binding protein
MQRREVLTLLGGVSAALSLARPLGAQPRQSAVIGFLGANTASVQQRYTAALMQRLSERGWVEGRNLTVEYRWAEGRYDRSPALVAELVARKVDVIVTHAPPNVVAAKRVTSDIPIVFAAVGDPVGVGVVASLARPGGNVTGLSLQSADSRENGWTCCGSYRPACGGWRFWGMPPVPTTSWNEARFRRPGKNWVLKLSSRMSKRRSRSHPLSRLSRIVWTPGSCKPTR